MNPLDCKLYTKTLSGGFYLSSADLSGIKLHTNSSILFREKASILNRIGFAIKFATIDL